MTYSKHIVVTTWTFCAFVSCWNLAWWWQRRFQSSSCERLSGYRPTSSSAPTADALSTNHGGVAIVAVPGVHLALVDALGDFPTTFECVRSRGRMPSCCSCRGYLPTRLSSYPTTVLVLWWSVVCLWRCCYVPRTGLYCRRLQRTVWPPRWSTHATL